jgi:glycosyltransferase involved in cell wall biosynthesis
MSTLAKAFADKGVAVDLVLAKAEGPFISEVGKSVRIVDLNAHRVLVSLPKLVAYIRRHKPYAMLTAQHYANVIAIWARRLSGVKMRLVVSERNTLSQSSENAASWRARSLPWIMRKVYPGADMVIAVSKGVADDLVTALRLPRDRVEVIYNPVVGRELIERSKRTLDHPWFSPAQPPVVLAAGRLHAQKDYPTLLRAFALVRRERMARLMILGEGEERHSLEEMIGQLGIGEDVALPGFVENPFPYMRESSVFVLSSRWEGLPGVLIQAMACGTPVVSTDCPSGPAEILEDGKWGRLVRVGDVNQLARAILDTIEDESPPDVAARASRFGVERAAEEYLKALDVIVE